jgi:hypothetical protein
MTLENRPNEDEAKEQTPTRQLNAALNPALRLQELLRREAGESQSAHALISVPVAEENEAAPPDEPAPPTIQEVAPASLPQPVLPREEPVLLVVVVNSERNTPVEYPSEEAMPTILTLEEKHRAYLLSDEWQRRGPVRIRTIRMRRRRL